MAEKKVSFLVILPPLIFAALAAVFYIGMQREDPDALPSTRIGQTAPVITDVALGQNLAVTPALFETGEVTVVNFWASWCPPCRAEHPVLLDMQKEGIRLVGINFKDTAEAALAYLEDEENPFLAIAFDPRGRSAIDWGVTAPPETFIISKEGIVLYRIAGPLVGANYDQRFRPELDKALAE